VFGIRIDLGRIGIIETQEAPGVLNNEHMQSIAEAKIWDLVLTSETG
jgi:hypothetical protein